MEFRQLEYFMRVYEEGSFTLAADSLYISQPALSKAIKKLEEELNIALIEISGKKLLITQAGELLYEQSKKICALYDNTIGTLFSLRGQEIGTVRIGTSYQRGALFWLYDLTERYCEKHPQVHFEIVSKESSAIPKNVLTGELDIGLTTRFGSDRPENLDTKILMSTQLWLLARKEHPIISKEVIDYEDFRGLNIFTTYDDLNRFFKNECQKRGFQPNISLITSQMDTIISLVVKNQGVALVGFTPEVMMHFMTKYDYPKLSKNQEVYSRRRIEGDRFNYDMVMYTRKDTQKNPLVKNLTHYIMESLTALQECGWDGKLEMEKKFYDQAARSIEF